MSPRAAVPSSALLSDEELARLLRAARERRHRNALRDHALLALLANLGMRPGEAVIMQRQHVHVIGPRPWVCVPRLKGRRERGPSDDLPITRPLAQLLGAFLRKLPSNRERRLFPLTVRQVERLFHTYARRAGFKRPLRVYCLRHTTAMRLLRQSGNDVRFVQMMLGHANLKTTMHYLALDADVARARIEQVETLL